MIRYMCCNHDMVADSVSGKEVTEVSATNVLVLLSLRDMPLRC